MEINFVIKMIKFKFMILSKNYISYFSKNHIFIHLGILFCILSIIYPFAYFKNLDLEIRIVYTAYHLIQDSLYHIVLLIIFLYPYIQIFKLWIFLLFKSKKNKKTKAPQWIFIDCYLSFFLNLYFYFAYYFNPHQEWGFRILGILIISIHFFITYVFFEKMKQYEKNTKSYMQEKFLNHTVHLLFIGIMIWMILYIKAQNLIGIYYLFIGILCFLTDQYLKRSFLNIKTV